MKFHYSRLLVLLALFLVASFLAFGCCGDCFQIGDESEPLPPYYDGTIYFPLHKDNVWRYRMNGDKYNLLQYMISDTLMWKNEVLYKFETISTSPPPIHSLLEHLAFMSSDTLHYTFYYDYLENPDLSKAAVLTIRILNPLRTGDSLSVPYYLGPANFGSYYWIISAANLKVETESDTFDNCLYLQYTYRAFGEIETHLLAEEYYAKDIGPVRIISHPYTLEPGDLGDTLNVYDLVDALLE